MYAVIQRGVVDRPTMFHMMMSRSLSLISSFSHHHHHHHHIIITAFTMHHSVTPLDPDSKYTSINLSHHSLRHLFGRISRIFMTISGIIQFSNYCSSVFAALHASAERRGLRESCLSVCLSNSWTVTEQKKALPRFLYHMKYKDHYL